VKVIVDTCIWSYALGRGGLNHENWVAELKELIDEVRVCMIGPVRQEILSGIKSSKQFQMLKHHLKAFPDLPIEAQDFELAAEFYNTAREKGIQGSNTDFLICALAARYRMTIFTADKDFLHLEKLLPISLHKPRFG